VPQRSLRAFTCAACSATEWVSPASRPRLLVRDRASRVVEDQDLGRRPSERCPPGESGGLVVLGEGAETSLRYAHRANQVRAMDRSCRAPHWLSMMSRLAGDFPHRAEQATVARVT
jgi:hypothetical protein